jgi:iron complex transport system ATP-binding protein
VADLVRRGRIPHTSVFRQWSAADQRAVDEALATTGLTGRAHEQVDARLKLMCVRGPSRL